MGFFESMCIMFVGFVVGWLSKSAYDGKRESRRAAIERALKAEMGGADTTVLPAWHCLAPRKDGYTVGTWVADRPHLSPAGMAAKAGASLRQLELESAAGDEVTAPRVSSVHILERPGGPPSQGVPVLALGPRDEDEDGAAATQVLTRPSLAPEASA